MASDERRREDQSKLRLVKKSIELGPVEIKDPNEFYQNRQSLYLWPEIMFSIKSSPIPERGYGPTTLSSYDLTDTLYDASIKGAFDRGITFGDPWELRARIEQMTMLQPNGEEGNLLTDGHANIFYLLEDFAVYVERLVGSRKWNLDTWKTDVDPWSKGNRVFVRGESAALKSI